MNRPSSIPAEIAFIRGRIGDMTNDELYGDYGIIVNDDKTVYDEIYERDFNNISEWLKFYGTVLAEEAMNEDFEDSFKGQFDDE